MNPKNVGSLGSRYGLAVGGFRISFASGLVVLQ